MASVNTSIAKNFGVFGWNYNRTNYKYDQTLRWQRFTSGRKQAMAQIDMFREDVEDLAGVSTCKLKVYGPIYGIVVTVCVTTLVEGRSGLKFPGPPVFISGIYLQCLAIGMSFICLAAWLLFHAAMRAQVACVSLRTRTVRIPVPTQRQLDGSRKLLSTWEEQGVYDMFRIPFVMPNGGNSPEHSDEEEEESPAALKGYNKGGIPGIASQLKEKVQDAHERGATTHSAKVPAFTPGNPGWYEKELADRKELPEHSPSGQGQEGPTQPYRHFELLRQAQKEWWGCEAYMRVCFLFGMMHLIMGFSYWITLHNIAELGMIWCSNLGAAGLTAGVWIMFRLDVLPEHGGCFPVEIGGPFVTSIAMGLMYSQQITQTMMDIGRGVAVLILIMHVLLTFRLYSVAKPTMGKATHTAKESGGRLFNKSAQCEAPAWLPSAFQHVMYLVAPPKTEEQLEKERLGRGNESIADEAMANVDMTPWRYVRTMILVVGLGWGVQLAGRAVECVMGERMLMSNPGQPPWSRTGQWYGWEHGPISSKHYAHVTPQRGHWAWQKGWGPQGQQELWASDMFGFAPEADAWWAEEEGPEPRVGAAGIGENTWGSGVLAYGQGEATWGGKHASSHDWMDSGGHRRLSAIGQTLPRSVVPVPVNFPPLLEPDHVVCAPGFADGRVVVLTSSGLGALVPSTAASGHAAAVAESFTLKGLLELGMLHSVTWGNDNNLLAVTASGALATCPFEELSTGSSCRRLSVPPLPGWGMSPGLSQASVFHNGDTIHAAIAQPGGRIDLLQLSPETQSAWNDMATVEVPMLSDDVPTVTMGHEHVLAADKGGVTYHWKLGKGIPVVPDPAWDVPVAGQRKWQSACMLPSGKVMRLASSWLKAKSGAMSLRSELLL